MTVVQMPDGTNVDFGDLPPDQIRSLIEKKFPDAAKQAKPPSVVEDALLSAGSGVVSGLHGIPGMAGDIQSALDQGAYDLGTTMRGWFGYGPSQNKPQGSALPTTAELETMTGWDKAKHVPQTTIGKIANTVGEFVPGAATMGGGLVKAGAKGLGSLVGKAGENTVKYGVTPGLVSGGAGTALEGTPLETPARVGGALLGAGVAGAIKGKAAGPTSADLKTEARQFYDQVGHVVVEPKSFAKVANDIAISTGKLGLHPKIHPKASAGLEELQKVIGTAPDFNEIDRLRQILGQAAKSADEGERFMAGKMIHQLDDWMDNLKPGDVISGDPRQAADTLIKARSLWNRARKAEIIENIKERAEKTVSTNYTHAGYITAVRRELRALSNRKDFKVRFRPDERQMINDIIHGGPVENIAKLFSRFAVRGAPSGAAALGLGFLSPPLAGAMMAAGEAGQFIANQTARGQVNRLEEMIRTGVAPPKLPPTIPPQLLPFYTMPGTAQSK